MQWELTIEHVGQGRKDERHGSVLRRDELENSDEMIRERKTGVESYNGF